ncbi:hypothetical protein FGO68_gene15636 [Halteria grandinella]|uniref:Uncharacterized protein n=1 Tax=Halteria grandinella TaxID=5974 RepID=A0A8J8SYM1_HALGN|nr:hypothetical protein FGO68_gene15636 [Halteria grandinella]
MHSAIQKPELLGKAIYDQPNVSLLSTESSSIHLPYRISTHRPISLRIQALSTFDRLTKYCRKYDLGDNLTAADTSMKL